MFDKYKEKLEKIHADVPKIFKKVLTKTAIKFTNEAKKITDKEKLVDTGNYRRNWHGKAVELQENTFGILAQNTVEYASHLEYGHELRNGKRYKGRFVGRQALDNARYYAIQKLDEEFENALKNQ